MLVDEVNFVYVCIDDGLDHGEGIKLQQYGTHNVLVSVYDRLRYQYHVFCRVRNLLKETLLSCRQVVRISLGYPHREHVIVVSIVTLIIKHLLSEVEERQIAQLILRLIKRRVGEHDCLAWVKFRPLVQDHDALNLVVIVRTSV